MIFLEILCKIFRNQNYFRPKFCWLQNCLDLNFLHPQFCFGNTEHPKKYDDQKKLRQPHIGCWQGDVLELFSPRSGGIYIFPLKNSSLGNSCELSVTWLFTIIFCWPKWKFRQPDPKKRITWLCQIKTTWLNTSRQYSSNLSKLSEIFSVFKSL